MSDAAIKTKTGKDWQQWFEILDKAGAMKMSRRDCRILISAACPAGGARW